MVVTDYECAHTPLKSSNAQWTSTRTSQPNCTVYHRLPLQALPLSSPYFQLTQTVWTAKDFWPTSQSRWERHQNEGWSQHTCLVCHSGRRQSSLIDDHPLSQTHQCNLQKGTRGNKANKWWRGRRKRTEWKRRGRPRKERNIEREGGAIIMDTCDLNFLPAFPLLPYTHERFLHPFLQSSYSPCFIITVRNFTMTLEQGLRSTCRLPRRSALQIPFKASFSTLIRTITTRIGYKQRQ